MSVQNGNEYVVDFTGASGVTEISGPGRGPGYTTAGDLETALQGQYLTITTTGGPIGMKLLDNPYTDNHAGSDGAPRFELVAVSPWLKPAVHEKYGYDTSDRRIAHR